MPNQANITVKNAAGTDVIYVAVAPSAGDKTPAIWTQNAVSGVQGLRPRFMTTARDSGSGDVRRLDFTLDFPVKFTDTSTGLEKALASVKFTGSVALPKTLATNDWTEAFTQAGNLLTSALVRSAVSDGYAPS